ncbi:DUF128 domain-containing protein [Methanococcoides sp. NM1]|uniref:DUF128 domain-containing protein n=1 Tax=Methanococcoides sp. NM1 TaxID=1201013 RepID=UPI001082C688|nr:DUF128 domain-containing protein [Methanococcoides sp. NM1]
MTDPQIERKLIEIMRVISESDKPIGARNIADELQNRGYNLGERAVRYHLRILDERGFTEKHGYNGRTITTSGRKELDDALIGDRLDFVITRIEELIYKTDYDSFSKKGNVIVNLSTVDKDDFDNAIDVMKYASSGDISISPNIKIFEEDSDPRVYVPPGCVNIATVCSITFDGLLLKSGIPIKPAYGGIIEMEHNDPVQFLDMISYSGTSIDPVKIFMMRHETSVLDVLDTGNGRILANMRNIPSSAIDKTKEVLKYLEDSGIGGVLSIGDSSDAMVGAPVEEGMAGILVAVGVNLVAAVEEAGIPVATSPVSMVLDYSEMSKL